jgi:methylglyoxal synthase
MQKTIALVAHDNRKADLLEWVRRNSAALREHRLVCTGTTGRKVRDALLGELGEQAVPEITLLKSGPLGGDQQLGALITESQIDVLVFLWDPMQRQPHDVDVKALLRISVLYNVPTACNRSTADFLITSELMASDYEPVRKDYSAYLDRELP